MQETAKKATNEIIQRILLRTSRLKTATMKFSYDWDIHPQAYNLLYHA
jgi:hypothetical protein